MDELLLKAINLFVETESATKAMLQRSLRIGYNRAAELMDQLELLGVVGMEMAHNPRQVLMTQTEWSELKDKWIEDSIDQRLRMHQKITTAMIADKPWQLEKSPAEVLDRSLFLIRAELSENVFNKWFVNLSMEAEGNQLILIVPNDFHKNVIESRYLSIIGHVFNFVTEGALESGAIRLKIIEAQ